MRAMLLTTPAPIETAPLQAVDLPVPELAPGEIRVRVLACAACHTDLHIVEGELAPRRLPIVPGHQIVGVIDKVASAKGAGLSASADSHCKVGDRVGIAWLHETCGQCRFCRSACENLCENARFTGQHAHGGYAEYTCIPEPFAYALPDGYGDVEAAPLMCSGIVGYRALKRSGILPGGRLGMYGFGGSAHIALQVARYWGCEVYVFTRGEQHRKLARNLGAHWVGTAEEKPPQKLDSSIMFAPAGALVPSALEALDKGGTLVLAGIYMSAIPSLDYLLHLYHERSLLSVANATREDGREFLALASRFHIQTSTRTFPLTEANTVLRLLKESKLEASAVLTP